MEMPCFGSALVSVCHTVVPGQNDANYHEIFSDGFGKNSTITIFKNFQKI